MATAMDFMERFEAVGIIVGSGFPANKDFGLSRTVMRPIEESSDLDVGHTPAGDPDQAQFDRELALLKAANRLAYRHRTPWPVKR